MDQSKDHYVGGCVLILILIIVGGWIYSVGLKEVSKTQGLAQIAQTLNTDGIILPVVWGDLGLQLIKTGIIDKQRFDELYIERGGLNIESKKLLESAGNGQLKITDENASFLLNLFWALGLGNKNAILEKGPMSDPRYGGAGSFASTGGWTLAQGDTMDHFSRHALISLTTEQQKLVERVSKNIYRPCCGNSTYFPDCNHGMAMLGLLELMASQGVSENEMYKAALTVNSYWFKDTYKTIAKYFEFKGVAWDKIDAQKALNAEFSSGSGYSNISAIVEQEKRRASGLPAQKNNAQGSGGGCSI